MDVRVPLSLALFVLMAHFAYVQSTKWKPDLQLSNTEFESFLFKSAMRSLQECIWTCTVTELCLIVTFRNSTRECRMYIYLAEPKAVANTSLWKACQSCQMAENSSALIVFAESKLQYDLANKTCVDGLGGHLATPATYGEIEQLKFAIRHKSNVPSWWIGGFRTESGWEWADGRPLNNTDEYWAAENPSGNGNCLQFWKLNIGYRYDDVYCSYHYSFVCESDKVLCCN